MFRDLFRDYTIKIFESEVKEEEQPKKRGRKKKEVNETELVKEEEKS